VGTFALISKEDGVFELSKMAVDESVQGKKIGHALLEHALAFSREKGINKIILYSHTKLQPALHLYRKFGFVEIPVGDSVYQRSDIKMEKVL
jgi:ribosomal protein S18 acetylase RimI-like enzyme